MIYSMSGVCSKMAAGESFLSFKFCLFYGGVIALLGFYAIAWQQIIRVLPLTTAFANKAVTTAWGLLWGLLFFHEQITIGKIVGVALVISGVILFSAADTEGCERLIRHCFMQVYCWLEYFSAPSLK